VKILVDQNFLNQKFFEILIDIPFFQQQDVACSDPMTGQKGRGSAEVFELSSAGSFGPISFARAHLGAVDARTRAPAKCARPCLCCFESSVVFARDEMDRFFASALVPETFSLLM